MNVRINKWGNSYGIKINEKITQQLSIKENDEMELNIIDNKLILSPKIKLNDMLNRINENSLHSGVEFETEGKELL